MRFLSVLLLVAVVALGKVSIIGCGELQNILRGSPQEEVALSEEEAWEKAVAVIQRMHQRTTDFLNSYFENPDPNIDIGSTIEQIDTEESGLSSPDIRELLDIHFEENPDDKAIAAAGDMSSYDLIGRYLQLSFQYPEKSREELLELFRELARNDGTEIHFKVVFEMYGL